MSSLTEDPFSTLDQQQDIEADSAPAVTPSGSVFVFDLETIPDESRFPRPVRVEKVKREPAAIDLAKLVTLTVPAIKAKIPSLSEDQLTQLMDLENGMAKPRSGVTDAITSQIAIDNTDDHEAAMNDWKKLSFNPFGNRIVALGIRSATHHVTMLAKNDDEERELLRVLWDHVNKFRVRCGYNITAFDDAVLIMRSMLLGVESPGPISRKRFGDRASIDLMTALFPSGQAQKLKEVCRMIGIVPPAGYEMSGDKVFDLVEAGDWANIAAYVESDAVIEFKLYQMLSEYLVF
ncbi:MAG TPA: hypothetical protein PLY87_18895 [Planctomycetaceae bacterium]|nr:hypothetical protein [Planctomycetaceae bacterium]